MTRSRSAGWGPPFSSGVVVGSRKPLWIYSVGAGTADGIGPLTGAEKPNTPIEVGKFRPEQLGG